MVFFLFGDWRGVEGGLWREPARDAVLNLFDFGIDGADGAENFLVIFIDEPFFGKSIGDANNNFILVLVED